MFPLEVGVGGMMLLALILYALSGGADFGAGVWDLLASGPRKEQQRALIAQAIAPVWEANHVWLIVVVVLLFVAFPTAFAAISTALHIPLVLMLVGIVLRGSAYVFRAYGIQQDVSHRRWGVVFAISSTITPVMLGVVLGAVSSGTIRVDVDTHLVSTDFVSSWWAPFPFAIGFLVLVMFVFLAAVYLIHETQDVLVKADFRMRALIAGGVVFVMAWISFGLSVEGAPLIYEGLWGRVWSVPFQGVMGMMATGALTALWVRWYVAARILAITQVVLMILGWGLAQFPFVLVPDLPLDVASAPDSVLRAVLIALGAGFVILIPSFWYLYWVFKVKKNEDAYLVANDNVRFLEVDEED